MVTVQPLSAVNRMWNLVDKPTERVESPVIPSASSSSSSICSHEDIANENGCTVCLECGNVLKSYFLVDTPSSSSNVVRPRKHEKTIYGELPSYLSHDVKALTIEIYESVTANRIFRNVFRRSIILACLHRAAILVKTPIFFEDMLEMFNLKIHDANRGISFVSINTAKLDAYKIPFWNDDICLGSVIANTDLRSIKPSVEKLFDIVKSRSNLLNNSHCKSIVCGCIYMVVKLKAINVPLKQLSQKCGMAEMTIVKKYIMIYKIVLSACMKRLFSSLLINARTVPYRPIEPPALTEFADRWHTVDALPVMSLRDVYEPVENIVVYDYENGVGMHATSATDGYVYPLDDVSNVYEWNLFLNKTYRLAVDVDGIAMEKRVNVCFAETTKSIAFNFNAYNAGHPAVSGSSILAAILNEYV